MLIIYIYYSAIINTNVFKKKLNIHDNVYLFIKHIIHQVSRIQSSEQYFEDIYLEIRARHKYSLNRNVSPNI